MSSIGVVLSILNNAGINSQISCKENKNIIVTRRDYLKKLALMLTQPQFERRNTIKNLSYILLQILKRFAN